MNNIINSIDQRCPHWSQDIISLPPAKDFPVGAWRFTWPELESMERGQPHCVLALLRQCTCSLAWLSVSQQNN